MSELPRSAFRFDPELVRAFVQDRLDDAGRATLADEVARMLPFHPGVVLALEQRRARDPYPHALAGYLVPDTTSGTLASLGQLIESRLADDRLDEAGCLALRSLALLADIAPRGGGARPASGGAGASGADCAGSGRSGGGPLHRSRQRLIASG